MEKGDAEGCKGEERPGRCRGEEKLHGEGRPGGCKQPHHPSSPVPAPHPHCRSFGDALPLKPATVLAGRAAGWQRGQVDVFPSWVGKLEKCEMDTQTFTYSPYCLFPYPGTGLSEVLDGSVFCVEERGWLQTALGWREKGALS